jgi:hypothetical protein
MNLTRREMLRSVVALPVLGLGLVQASTKNELSSPTLTHIDLPAFKQHYRNMQLRAVAKLMIWKLVHVTDIKFNDFPGYSIVSSFVCNIGYGRTSEICLIFKKNGCVDVSGPYTYPPSDVWHVDLDLDAQQFSATEMISILNTAKKMFHVLSRQASQQIYSKFIERLNFVDLCKEAGIPVAVTLSSKETV